MPGIGELLIILLIVMVVFGASKLPELGDGIGRAIGNFKRAVRESDDGDTTTEQLAAGHERRALPRD